MHKGQPAPSNHGTGEVPHTAWLVATETVAIFDDTPAVACVLDLQGPLSSVDPNYRSGFVAQRN